MRLVDLLLPEFDHEMASTRRVLARAPAAMLGWRPHEKSWTLGGISTHLANLPSWGVSILKKNSYDLVRDAGERPVEKTSVAEVLSTFDGHVRESRTALVEITEGELIVPWSLKRDGVVIMSVPRIQAFKSFAINHAVHHRGQLTVYLRLQNIPLPPIYGPTADEAS
jgi:uncharacterized damage-inducible protein DinB